MWEAAPSMALDPVHDPRGPFCACWRSADRFAWESRYGLSDSKRGLAALQRGRWSPHVLAVSADQIRTRVDFRVTR